MTGLTNEQMSAIVEQLKQQAGLVNQLPEVERSIALEALQGQSVYEIAQNHRLTEAAIWKVLSSAARFVSDQPVGQPVETGGLGSDTDPGVTGGYGDTGFGSLGNEPPVANPEEPDRRG